MLLSYSLVLGVATASLTTALTLPTAREIGLSVRDTVDPGQDSRSCLSLRDVCDPTTISDAGDALSHPACIALVVCETPEYFFDDFPPSQPRLSRDTFNVVSGGSDVITQQQFIDFYYGTIASINSTVATYNSSVHVVPPEYPSSADAVIGWWQNVVAWTGFCSTSSIPYSNFADWIQYSTTPGVCGAVQSCDVATNPATPACVPQRSTDNGSCAEMVAQCSILSANASHIFDSEYCVLASFCYSESTVDVLIKKLVHDDYLYTGQPVLSINQPRLSQDVFNTLSEGNSVVSQQNIIDAYYGALTNTVRSCGGPPGAETVCPSGTSGPYPTDASYVIDLWETVSAWTGFCSTREVPYQNLADYLQYSSTVQAPTSC